METPEMKKCEICDTEQERGFYICDDCDTMYCGECEHNVECDQCLTLHCPKDECVCEIIPCIKCDCNNITKNSTDYYAMKCDDNGENFICDICYEDEYDEAEWDECYGVKTTKTKVYIMAGGGSHWWNYVVEFDDEHGEQLFVYKENKDGRKQQFRMRLAYRHKDGVEELRLVPLDWQPAEDKDEGLVTYY